MTYRQRKERRNRGRGKLRTKFILGFGVIIAVGLIGVLSVVGYIVSIAATAPDINNLKPINKGANSEILAADGSRLGYVQSDEIRTPIAWKDMPDDARNAVVSIEDERFYQHKGVDYDAIVRAGVRNVETGKSVQGGSTLTQQLVRALYIRDPQRNLQRKIREAKLASELEKRHSKTWILQNYLNDVPFGTVNGPHVDRPRGGGPDLLQQARQGPDPAQAALLAGLPQAPSEYNPFRDPDAALKRRGEVLRQDGGQPLHQPGRGADAKQAPLGLKRGTRYTTRREPYFFDYVQEKLIEHYGAAVYRRGGLKVYTTINPKLQDVARKRSTSSTRTPATRRRRSCRWTRTTATSARWPRRGTLQRPPLQPGRAGPPPAGLGVQGDGAHRRRAAGHQPGHDHLPSKPLNLNVPGYGPWQVKTFDGTYGGTMNLVRATAEVRQHRVRAARPGRRPEEGVPRRRICWASRPSSTACPPRAWAACAWASPRWRWPAPTPRWPTAACATEPTGIRKVVFPDGKSETFDKDKRKRVFTDGAGLDGHQDPGAERAVGHRHARPTSAAPRPARPAPPTTRGRMVRGLHAQPGHARSGSAIRTRAWR